MSEQPGYRDPPYTVDAVIENAGRLALIERGEPPFEGLYALPGGHVDPGESPEAAVVREAGEELGISIDIIGRLGDYSQEIDEPRYSPDEFDHQAYACTTAADELVSGDDAADAEWVAIADLPDSLAFGHETIINDYCEQYTDD